MKNLNTPGNVKDLSGKTEEKLSFEKNVLGPNLECNLSLKDFINSYERIGFQATNIRLAIQEVNKMKNNKIFLGCTSNIISSGIRDIIKHLAKYKMVDVMVITGGGIEEDIIKTLSPHKIASFGLKGKVLRKNGLNRIGNLVVSNDSYSLFEKWLNEILDEMLINSSEKIPLVLTPSSFIKILGSKIKRDDSILYWASLNNIPIYSPALTDGSIGDILTFYPKRNAIKLDIVEDVYNINCEAMHAEKTGAIILGAGLIKHHILNANLFKNGLNHCVLINTANEYDGSDSGANIEEAISWGKIRAKNKAIKIFGDATIVFPLLVSGSFLSNKTRE